MGHDCERWKSLHDKWIRFLLSGVSCMIQTNSVSFLHLCLYLSKLWFTRHFPYFCVHKYERLRFHCMSREGLLISHRLKNNPMAPQSFHKQSQSTSLMMAPCHQERPRRLCFPCENRATRCPCAVSTIHTQPWFTPAAKRPVSVKYLLPPGGRSGQMKCEAPGTRRRRWRRRKRAAQTLNAHSTLRTSHETGKTYE